MKDIKTFTIPEYVVAKKKYFTTPGNEDAIIKCVSVNFGCGYEVWTKYKTLEDAARIYWSNEPLMKRYFNSEKEVLKALTDNDLYKDGIAGVYMRWLPGNHANDDGTVVLQNFIVPKTGAEKTILEHAESNMQSRFFGMMTDPYTYVGPFAKDESGYFDNHNPEYDNPDNYRVFYIEMTREEYEKEEKEYIECEKTGQYKDDFITICGRDSKFTDLFENFIMSNTQIKVSE